MKKKMLVYSSILLFFLIGVILIMSNEITQNIFNEIYYIRAAHESPVVTAMYHPLTRDFSAGVQRVFKGEPETGGEGHIFVDYRREELKSNTTLIMQVNTETKELRISGMIFLSEDEKNLMVIDYYYDTKTGVDKRSAI